MAKDSKSWTEAAEIICMINEVLAHERHVCNYCKVRGHKRAKCPVFARLWSRCTGDRAINKVRGNKSMDLRIKARGKLKVRSGKTYRISK